MRPKGLLETTIAMCLMNVAGVVFIDPSVGSLKVQFIGLSVLIAVTFFVIWQYWLGKNWARLLVLLTSLVALLNLFALSSEKLLSNSLIVVEAIFAVFILWWLNTQKVKSYFKQVSTPEQSNA